ncbi:hypothetical protein DF153_21085 [Burkholderia cenocepacia]|nr:hypothetical protein DF152_12935 [Burkholderia cenocepacia]RQU21003.1 hypothetical protein DF153_21085 [Burkholderia cenocepacia]
MTTNTYGGYTVDQLREFIRHHYDAEHGGDNIDELTNDSSASVKIVLDLLDAIEPQQNGDLLRPIARWVYNAVRVNLDLLHGICSEFGCPQGEDVATWLRDRLSNEKSPAPEQASEAAQQRSGMDRPFTEVVPAAEVIVDARAGDGNETSSKVSRADPLTEESARKTAHRIYCNLGYCGSDPHCFNGADSVTQQRWIRAVKDAAPLFCASAVEQPGSITAQIALAAIKTFEIVGESNDSREPNDEDRFILTEFIAHAFGGFRVEQPSGAPTMQYRLHGIARVDLELVERETRALAHTPPAPAPTDERAAFVKLMGYDRPETEGVAVDVWDSQRATWLEALAFARARSANWTGAEGTMALPHWFKTFLTNVCEIPDRNSPEGEPDAIVATLDELRDCAVNAIEQCGSFGAPALASEPVAIPAGYALVPIEPTDEMVTAGVAKGDSDFYGDALVRAEVRSDYRAMIAAAPPQPAQADARVGLTFDKWWSVGGWRLVSQAGDKNGWRGAAEAGYIGGLFATAAAATKPEPRADAVGCLTVRRFRGADSMVNTDFDYYGNLPDGSYPLYIGAVPEPRAEVTGWKLAMRVLQSDLYQQLDDAERAECDALAHANPYAARTGASS